MSDNNSGELSPTEAALIEIFFEFLRGNNAKAVGKINDLTDAQIMTTVNQVGAFYSEFQAADIGRRSVQYARTQRDAPPVPAAAMPAQDPGLMYFPEWMTRDGW